MTTILPLASTLGFVQILYKPEAENLRQIIDMRTFRFDVRCVSTTEDGPKELGSLERSLPSRPRIGRINYSQWCVWLMRRSRKIIFACIGVVVRSSSLTAWTDDPSKYRGSKQPAISRDGLFGIQADTCCFTLRCQSTWLGWNRVRIEKLVGVQDERTSTSADRWRAASRRGNRWSAIFQRAGASETRCGPKGGRT